MFTEDNVIIKLFKYCNKNEDNNNIKYVITQNKNMFL